MKSKNIIFIILFFLSTLLSFKPQDLENNDLGGLKFFDNNLNIDERTSLKLFNHPQSFPNDSLILSFDISLSGGSQIGHLVTCKNTDDEEYEIFNSIIVYMEDTEEIEGYIELTFNLTFANKQIKIKFSEQELKECYWHPFKLKIYPKRGIVQLEIANHSKTISYDQTCNIKLNEKVDYIFGKCDHYLEVPEFAIKNLNYTADKTQHHFPLIEAQGNKVHGADGKILGTVTNPDWIYQRHSQWKKTAEIPENQIAAVYHDKDDNKIYMYTSHKVYIYNIRTEAISTHEPEKPYPFRIQKGGGFNYWYDDQSDQLLMYNNKFKSDNKEAVAIFDNHTFQVKCKDSQNLSCKYHHNSFFPNKNATKFYQFGGFGRMKYFNKFICMDTEDYEFTHCEFEGDTIPPRYYCGYCTDFEGDREQVYLFGGYGNDTGKQDEGGRFHTDLFRLDMETHQIKKIFEFDIPEWKRVPCRDLLLGEDGHSFYTLCYPYYKPECDAKLYRFDWKDGTCSECSDSIRFISSKISTQVHLFEDKATNTLISVIQEFKSAVESKIKIHTISTPVKPLIQEEKFIISRNGKNMIIIGMGVLLLVLAISLPLALRKRNKKNKAGSQNRHKIQTVLDELHEEDKEKQKPEENSIFLLGDFTVFDKEGKDITYLFSSKIRQLFLLILLNSVRSTSKGISSNEISSILWPEKELSKSKNIRAVTMKNMRDAISTVEGIQIINVSGKWIAEIDNSICHCDFIDIRYPSIDIAKTSTYDEIRPYIRKLRRGQFLKSEEYEWLDTFKSEFEENVLNVYAKLMLDAFHTGEYVISYKISQVLLKIDPLNDNLMKIEVNSLVGLGDTVKAMMKFRQFSINYYDAYGKSLLFEDYVESK